LPKPFDVRVAFSGDLSLILTRDMEFHSFSQLWHLCIGPNGHHIECCNSLLLMLWHQNLSTLLLMSHLMALESIGHPGTRSFKSKPLALSEVWSPPRLANLIIDWRSSQIESITIAFRGLLRWIASRFTDDEAHPLAPIFQTSLATADTRDCSSRDVGHSIGHQRSDRANESATTSCSLERSLNVTDGSDAQLEKLWHCLSERWNVTQ
jgi:hypothetical protein